MNDLEIIQQVMGTDKHISSVVLDKLFTICELVRENEREVCAKVCDGWPDYDVHGLGEAIRARGKIIPADQEQLKRIENLVIDKTGTWGQG